MPEEQTVEEILVLTVGQVEGAAVARVHARLRAFFHGLRPLVNGPPGGLPTLTAAKTAAQPDKSMPATRILILRLFCCCPVLLFRRRFERGEIRLGPLDNVAFGRKGAGGQHAGMAQQQTVVFSALFIGQIEGHTAASLLAFGRAIGEAAATASQRPLAILPALATTRALAKQLNILDIGIILLVFVEDFSPASCCFRLCGLGSDDGYFLGDEGGSDQGVAFARHPRSRHGVLVTVQHAVEKAAVFRRLGGVEGCAAAFSAAGVGTLLFQMGPWLSLQVVCHQIKILYFFKGIVS